MTLKLKITHVLPVLFLGFASIPLTLSAQTTAPGENTNWRNANDAVGQLKRGHADVLKWEKANTLPSAMQGPVADGLKLLTIEDVTRQAWRTHRELTRSLARLDTATIALIVTGRWTDVDPSLQRKVDGMDEVLEVAVQARKAWLRAVATRQPLAQYRAALDATEAANELGMRMVNLGNWSKLQQTKTQLAQSAAKMNLVRAQYTADQAQASLIKLLGLRGQYTHVTLPESLPDVPPQLTPRDELQKKAMAIQGQLPVAEGIRNQSNVELALAAYHASHALVNGTRDEVLKTREFISEETLLHYNGMLSSVWDLLDESRNRSQAVINAIGAQHDFWIAEADLQWVLQGGEPESFVSLGGGGEAATSAAH